MTKLDFFTIHVEPENSWMNVSIELNFICEDHTTVIECEGINENVDLSHIRDCLKLLFEDEASCTYAVKQRLDSFKHNVTVYDHDDDPAFDFECDAIKITEHD